MMRQLWAKTKNKDLFTTADKCLEGECSIDDVDDLLGELRRTIRCVFIIGWIEVQTLSAAISIFRRKRREDL